MSYIKTRGIIIKEVNTGEADKIVRIFSKSLGRISGSAKGARRTKSRFVASTQLLCYSDFVLFKGKEIYSINSADIIEPFYEIRNDIVKLTYTAHILDLINDVVQENQPATRVLQLFLNTLHMLSKTDKSPELITRIFELRFLTILGYSPYVVDCMECGSENLGEMLFSFKKCGFLCHACGMQDKLAMRISVGTAKAIQHVVRKKNNELFNFSLSQQVLDELRIIMRRYIKDRLEKEYNKLDFLNELNINNA